MAGGAAPVPSPSDELDPDAMEAPLQPPQIPPSKQPSKWRDNVKLATEIAVIVYTVFSGLQLHEINRTNQLTTRALNDSDKALNQTLTKMQGQIDVANSLYGEAQKQTLQVTKTASEAHASVEQAKTAEGISRKQFIQDQRPYLWIDDKVPEYNFVMRFEAPDQSRPQTGRIATELLFRNYGKSPAIGVRSFAYISTSLDPANDIDWSDMPPKGEGGIYPPGGTFTKTPRTKSDVGIALTYPRPINLDGNNDVWAMHALIEYSDQSGASYVSEVCRIRQFNGFMKKCSNHKKLN